MGADVKAHGVHYIKQNEPILAAEIEEVLIFFIIGAADRSRVPHTRRIAHERPNSLPPSPKAISTPFGCRSRPIANSRPIHGFWRARRACTTGLRTAARCSTRVAGLWCVNAGHGRREITEAVAQQLDTMEFAPDFPDGSSDRLRTGQSTGEARAARAGSHLLHQFRFRVGRYRAENRRRPITARAAQGPTHPLHRPREGLSRRRLRRHVGRRHGQQSQVLRLLDAAGRGSSAAHARYRAQRVLARPAAVGRAPGQRTGAPDRVARCLDHRGGHRRADLRIRRRDAAADRLFEAPARNLRQARHSADIRRGDHRLRPRRQALRRPGLRRDPGPDDHGQGTDQRRRAHGRGVLASQDLRCLHAGTGERRSSCFTAIRTRRIRSPAPPRWRPSTSMRRKAC